jgi:hypothetical protein
MEVSGRRIARGGVFGAMGIASYRTIAVYLARCTNEKCGRFARVLPLELLPYKTYGIDLIEDLMRGYVSSGHSLRRTVRHAATPAEHSPSHTSLYRWLGSFGTKLLELTPSATPPSSTPSAVLVQSSRVIGQDVVGLLLRQNPSIAPLKYRSEKRFEELRAAKRLLIVVTLLFGDIAAGLRRWNELMLPWFFVPVWHFPRPYKNTPMQRAPPA